MSASHDDPPQPVSQSRSTFSQQTQPTPQPQQAQPPHQSEVTCNLSPDDADELLYLARADERAEFKSALETLAFRYAVTQAQILTSCVDAENGNTVLHLAAANGLDDLLQECLNILQATSDPTSATTQTITQSTDTSSTSTTTLINAHNQAGNTALHWASLTGHLSTVKILVQGGAQIWTRNAAGNLAIFEAEQAEKEDVVTYLLQVGGEGEMESGENGNGRDDHNVDDVDVDVDGEGGIGNRTPAHDMEQTQSQLQDTRLE